MSEEKAQRKRSLTSLWLLLALCAAPVVASYVAYHFWQPSGQVNHGELLPPQPLPDAHFRLIDGTPFQLHQLKGKWVLVMADSGRCDAFCQRKLVYLRQVRLAQGKEKERIERVWLITDEERPEAALLAQHEGAWAIRAAGSGLLELLPVKDALGDHVFVIDPLGNLMMRYPPDFDPRKMVKDIARLLRHSKWR
jgi:cytochrome oxidase Cu insertion factor (SCO1/SenC/PrrC family)